MNSFFCKGYSLTHIVLLLSLAAPICTTANTAESQPAFHCIVHAHSDISSGKSSLQGLTSLARSNRIDAIFLTDNLTRQIQFGLPPLRNVFWAGWSLDSIMTRGVRNYLDAIGEENRRQTNVLYIPGVETCPRTYWTGTPWQRNLVCHDHQKNLMVLGLKDPDLVAQLPEGVGYVRGRHTPWIVATRILLVLLLAALLLAWRAAPRLARRTDYSTREIRASLCLTLILPLILLMGVCEFLARKNPALQIYGEDAAERNIRRIIRRLSDSGHFTYWAHPEAKDHHVFTVAGIPFTADTRPYPELLQVTDGYNAFGGVYEDLNTLYEPGNVWDSLLQEYLEGVREKPIWCLGEMLYHYEGQAGKTLRNVETIIWAPEKTEKALLDALSRGRFYARRNSGDQSLEVTTWSVAGGRSGDIVTNQSSSSVDLLLEVTSTNTNEPIEIKIIRNGQ
ncbi:MAG: hypothetical protein V2A34_13620, partial [Lentisphaerota bacterium]